MIKTNIKEEVVQGHRFGKKLTNSDYGTVYHVGDYLPDGTQFSGTNDEWEAFIKQDFRDRAEADGYDVYDDPDGDGFIIDLDGSYNPNN